MHPGLATLPPGLFVGVEDVEDGLLVEESRGELETFRKGRGAFADDPAFPCSTAHPWVEIPMLGEAKRVSICLGSKEARSAEVTAGLLVVCCCGKLGRGGFGARGGFTMGLAAL